MPRITLVLALTITVGVAVGVVGLQDLGAQPTGLGETILSSGVDLELEVLPGEAAFTSEIRLVLPSGTFPLATSQEVGRVVRLELAPAGVELIFEIFVRETEQTFRTGPGERNPDGLAHATVMTLGPSTWTVGFEDTAGGGDFDFNDVVFQVRPGPSRLGPPSASNPSGTIAEPVNTATGNYLFQRTDLALPGRGLPVIFTRTYNALDPSAGPLGHGWTHSFNVVLTENVDRTVVIKQGDGHEELYGFLDDGSYQPLLGGVFNTLVKHPDVTFTLTTKDQIQHRFSPAGLLTHILDRNGNALSLSYDADGHLITLTDTVGRTVTLDYDPEGRIAFITDPIGRIVHYSYDVDGNLAADTDPNGGVTQYSYDTAHQLVRITDPRGILLVENTYDVAGRVVAQTNGRGFVTTFAYGSPQPGDTSISDPRGGTTIHTHDEQLRLIAVTDPLGHQASLTYDAENNRTSITDKNGAVTRFTYDGRGNVTSVIDPLGHIITFTYDPRNNLTSSTNVRGLTTILQYDAQGNLSSVQDALRNVTTLAYDDFGQLTDRTDARGHVTHYTYDAQGNATDIIDALGRITSIAYDGIGRFIRLTNPNGHAVAANYDVNSRLIRAVDPFGHATTFAYDPVGNLIEIIDAKGNTSRYDYDEPKNLSTVTDALGRTTRYTYDANNNRTGVTDANSHTTTYTFDALNRLATIADPLGHTTTYAYDPIGNVIGVEDANGTKNSFGYDANYLLTAIAYGDGSSVAYRYDGDGNRVSRADRRGTTTYKYDAVDRLVQITHADGRAVAYRYDAVGNQIRLTYPDGKEATYGYDALDRLVHVLDWGGRETRYLYDAASNLLEIQYPNRTSILYRYDAANQLVEVRHDQAGALLARLTYTLDALGNRIEMMEESLLTPRMLFSNVYDALSQLVALEKRPDGQPIQRTEYTYDHVGNRLSLTTFSDKGEGAPVGSIMYTYDASNRLLQAGNTGFTYDANGNRLAETIPGERNIQYAYDAANRLIRVRQNGTEVAYTYDGDGNKVEEAIKAPDESGETRTIRFLNDEAAELVVVLTQDVVAERGGPEEPIHYLYGLALISEELSGQESPGPFFYLRDGLGSIIALTNSLGMVQAQYRYDAWGNLDQSLGNVSNRFLFTGEEQDPKTRLYYLRARWYDPTVGRFLTKDPIGEIAKLRTGIDVYRASYYVRGVGTDLALGVLLDQLQGSDDRAGELISLTLQRLISEDPLKFSDINLYTYVGNNPIGFIDPTGQNPLLSLAVRIATRHPKFAQTVILVGRLMAGGRAPRPPMPTPRPTPGMQAPPSPPTPPTPPPVRAEPPGDQYGWRKIIEERFGKDRDLLLIVSRPQNLLLSPAGGAK